MAKRYHASKRARRDERMGMERYERGPVNVNHERDRFNDEHRSDKDRGERGFLRNESRAMEYMGMPVEMRRGLERPEMIYEDHRAIANMPQEVMIKPYPMTGPYLPEDLNDDIRAVDAQMDYDDSQRREHFYPKKV